MSLTQKMVCQHSDMMLAGGSFRGEKINCLEFGCQEVVSAMGQLVLENVRRILNSFELIKLKSPSVFTAKKPEGFRLKACFTARQCELCSIFVSFCE